ncbi:MAG: DUF4105 domain-containing protein [Deltaproteobacteria bacterium]|nr:DUF4105 domain-containing protein [Deltaproteobacteria bacterium]
MKRFALGLLAIPVLLTAAWGALALTFRVAGPWWLGRTIAFAFFAVVLAILLFVHPLGRKSLALALAFGVLFLWWSTIRPSNDRDWSPEVARPPHGEISGDTLVLHDVRDFDYRSETDFTERWETRTYDLSKITGADLFLSYWGSPSIAHTIVSWEFADAPPLAISIETRKERGEEYSAVRGFFREYELYYVAADERDLIRLRTSYRGEQVYLYRLRGRPELARALLLDYVETMNELAERPRFYNAAVDNCTTGIRVHAQHVGGARPWDWRILVNGYGDQMLYERGSIDTTRPFEQLKAESLIVERARAADRAPDFSERIREGLPPRPSPGAPPAP